MRIETERLILRGFSENDGEGLYEYLSDRETLRFEPYPPYGREQAMEEARRRSVDQSFWAATLKNGKLIGNFYLAPADCDGWELGYVFNRRYWGNGFATEGAKALLDFVFTEKNAWRVFAMCDPRNLPSWKLLERLRMRREGELKKNVYFFRDENGNPIWKDTYLYGVLREEWNRPGLG